MSTGPGKYDYALSQVRRATQAQACALIVIGGKHGHGFGIQGPLEMIAGLPGILRTMADEIEKDIATPDAPPV